MAVLGIVAWCAAVAAAGSACSYGITFRDCEVTCQVSDPEACPEGLTCAAGVCRIEGAGASCLAPGEETLRQTADDKVERSLEFGCTNPDQSTAAGSWYRVFPANAGPFTVSKVTLGICFSSGVALGPNVDIHVGTYGGGANDQSLDLAKVARLNSAGVRVAPTQISRLVEVPLIATIPAGKNLIVEVEVPDFKGTGQELNMGFTAGGETKPGYVRSPLCGPAIATKTTAAGLPNAHLVLTVTGTP